MIPPPFLLLVTLLFLFNLSSAFLPLDNYLLVCGSSVTHTTPDNRIFFPDSSNNLNSIPLKHPNPSPSLSPLYHTARLFTKSSNYLFRINQKGTHLLRFHFHPFQSQTFNLSHALFHLSANQIFLLKNFTPLNNTNPISYEYIIHVTTDHLKISFTLPDNSPFAFVNAIELFSAPPYLIGDTAIHVNGLGSFTGLMAQSQSFETLYRVNVGGKMVTPFNDSLWRTWVPDHSFFFDFNTPSLHFTGPIKYQNGGLLSPQICPDNVYNSARVMKDYRNMTFVFGVPSHYSFMLRLHFCDIATKSLNEIYLNVYINRNLALEDLDLSAVTGQTLAAPYYVDFVVDDVDSTGVLTVTVGPSKLSRDLEVKALLNGLEVMKMNNSMGSLDGELPVGFVFKSSQRGIGFFLPSVALMSLVVGGLLFLHTRTKIAMEKESVKWSRLPMVASDQI